MDSPLKGLERYEGAPFEEIRVAARHALTNLVDLAIAEKVAFVLIAGDIYDGDWRDYNTGRFFIGQVARLQEAGVPLYLISGNHDAANKMTRSLRLPDNVTFFSTDRPETAVIEDYDVAIHGQSFATAAVFQDLSESYPAAISGNLNIGLLHTCATGREGHDRYAPCTVEGLKLKNYDYWALGHIHQRWQLAEEPLIVFPGNLQGRHIRETGAKGCLLVTVNDDRSLQPEFHALDVMRWEVATVDVSGAIGTDDAIDSVSTQLEKLHREAEGRTLAIRVELTGKSKAHRTLNSNTDYWINEIRSQAMIAGQGQLWIEKVKLRTSNVTDRTNAGQLTDGALAELSRLFEQMRLNPDQLVELDFDFGDVVKKLPAELKQLVATDEAEWLQSAIVQAESLLFEELLGEKTVDVDES